MRAARRRRVVVDVHFLLSNLAAPIQVRYRVTTSGPREVPDHISVRDDSVQQDQGVSGEDQLK